MLESCSLVRPFVECSNPRGYVLQLNWSEPCGIWQGLALPVSTDHNGFGCLNVWLVGTRAMFFNETQSSWLPLCSGMMLTKARMTRYSLASSAQHWVRVVVQFSNPRPRLRILVALSAHSRFLVPFPDPAIANLERLVESDSKEELGQLCGMSGKYHRNK